MGFFDSIFGKKPSQTAKRAEPAIPSSRLDELKGKFPFPVQAFHGSEVEAELLRLRAHPDKSRGLPVIIGDFEHAERLVDLWSEPYDFRKQLEKANAIYVEEWFEERRKEDPEIYESQDQLEVHEGGTAHMTQLTAGQDYKGRYHAEVFVAMVPDSDASMIPLHLRFGDWNACPSPCEHTAVARYWRDRCGAEIATVSSDVVEFTVTRPPRSDADALDLAWQQYIYCSDIVDQGMGSVATLARALRGSTRWYFWWD